jgi:VCBS repeat-containing protein
LLGGDGNDVLFGDGGHDTFYGGAGDDEVWAEAGDHYLDGGAGVDKLIMTVNSARAVDFSVMDTRPVTVAGLTFTGMERLSFVAGGGDDRVFGGDWDDRVSGRVGDDQLFGLAGSDVLSGDEGDDRLLGGHDNDQLNGGEGDDELTGGGADDRLNGGDGVDTARFGAHSSNYRFELTESGLLRVLDTRPADPSRPGSQTDGVDTLQDMELLQFTDRTVTVAEVLRSIRPPVAGADAAVTSEDAPVTFDLLANDSDPDGDALTLASVSTGGLKGTVSLGAGGAVTYRPGAEHQGLGAGESTTETFTYLVQDQALNTTRGTATVTITGVNDAPVASGDRFTIGEDDGARDVTALLLSNDRDPDRSDVLTISDVQGVSASGATIRLSPNGQVSYDPGKVFQSLGAGETATDTFSYTVRDPSGALSTATATVTIQGAADEEGPVLPLLIMEDQVSENLLDQLAEAFGVVRVTGVSTQGTLGDVALSANGEVLTFSTENLDHLLADSTTLTRFSWTGVTAGGAAKSGSFEVYVGGEYDPITAVADSVTATEGVTTGNLWTTLLSNDIDPEGAVHTRLIIGVDTAGTVGAVQYDRDAKSLVYVAPDLAPGETLIDTFRYTAHDAPGPNGFETTAVVTVTVTGGSNGASAVSVAKSVENEIDSFDFSLAAATPAGADPAWEMARSAGGGAFLEDGQLFADAQLTPFDFGLEAADGFLV